MQKLLWFFGGMVLGLTALSFSKASVPKGKITDDTSLYQNLSEIRVSKVKDINFDAEIRRLSQKESQFQEKLSRFPTAKKTSKKDSPAVQRVRAQKYSGNR